MDIKITLQIDFSDRVCGFLDQVLGGEKAHVASLSRTRQEPEENMHAAAEQTERAETAESPQPQRRRGRPPKTETVAEPDTNASGDPDGTPEVTASAGSNSGPTATIDASPSDESEETLADALGIADELTGDFSKKDVDEKIQEAMAAVGNVKLLQQTLFEATGFKGSGSMAADKYGAAIAALDKAILAAG